MAEILVIGTKGKKDKKVLSLDYDTPEDKQVVEDKIEKLRNEGYTTTEKIIDKIYNCCWITPFKEES